MTEKLYYTDAYIKQFSAEVISVAPFGDMFRVLLDKTAFFPEEGGQSADTGYIGGARVVGAVEEAGKIYHITDSAPEAAAVNCVIDFALRLEKMQCHTAEHILCGIIHSLYGFDNVGFHLGDEEVTFDINGTLSREQLDRVELMANEAVYSNIAVECFFPTKQTLSTIDYRSKLNITDGVRIVKIGDVDSCACCAPHVSRTGEIGLIKILDFMKHRGGTRIWMTAGKRALIDYRKKYGNLLRISAMLSSPQHNTADALEKYIAAAEKNKSELKLMRIDAAEAAGRAMAATEGNAVCYLENYNMDELRAFANAYGPSVAGMLVVLSGSDGDYKYVISSETPELGKRIKEINLALSGKGGGRNGMAQGSFATSLERIKEYFK